MPRLLTMSTIVTRAKRRADKENDDHISTAEWKALISEVYGADVYSVVAQPGTRYFEYLATLTTTGAAYVEEPDDLLSVLRLDYVATSTDRRQLFQAMPGEEPKFAALSTNEPLRYSLIDDRIYLFPTPSTGLTLEMRYIPQPPDLGDYDDADLVDVVSPDGEACLIWGVAALALGKSKQDASFAVTKTEAHKAKLQEWAAERIIGEASRRIAIDVDESALRHSGDYYP
jgi:hypothetical protein